MPKTTNPAPRTRSVAAAARAAAKRAERAGTETARPAPAPAPEPSARARRLRALHPRRPRLRRPRPRVPGLVLALAALVVAGLVAALLLGLEYREAEQTRRARGEALAAAQQAAPEVFSYDHRHLDRDFAAARRHLTRPFLGEYEKTTASVVARSAREYKGVVKAEVASPESGVPAASTVSATPDEVVVLLFMNQLTDSTQVKGERVDLNRVRMTMSRTDDGWKVSAVDAL